ncbi:MAG TPA: urate oxidase [Bryobacteraceae bacterium]|nr:urate oxidase [Bryobacteraceae bacterium]
MLLDDRYGASSVLLMKVNRARDPHELKELAVDVSFRGDFGQSYAGTDNSRILPADTIKNTIYALAKLYPILQIEDFARQVADHFLTDNSHVSRVDVAIKERFWAHIPFGGKGHPWTFTPGSQETRTARISSSREEASIEAGIENLQVIKTAGSAFEGYRKDPFTTLEESADRLFSATIQAAWLYDDNEIPFGVYWHGVRAAILESFLEHESRSLQHTLHSIAEGVLERYADIREIRLALPSHECRLVDLRALGLENQNEVFAPAENPCELIEARIRRV